MTRKQFIRHKNASNCPQYGRPSQHLLGPYKKFPGQLSVLHCNYDVSFPILGNLNRAKTWAIGGGAAPLNTPMVLS